MTTQEILDGIFRKQTEIGMTNQQFSDASSVPKATIERIKRGDTPNPTMQTILDLAGAVGYTFSNHPDQVPAAPQTIGINDPLVQHIIYVYENRCLAYEERIKRNTSHFNMLLAEKNRWIKFSLTLNLILIVFLVSVLILDILHPDIGWVRDQLSNFSTRNFGDVMLRAVDWLRGI